ncbi:hypothetical protein [Pseudanabaena sp. SR411]|uniref:hypothetical protein n=1 Tax=Pseudanabaena sp. SR411 TaxID=1980935 RepID=UPI000B98277B|nr:hypothetical protein [Pseudanabaena sp. SR411]
MRTWIFILASITFAITGWNFGQLLLTEFGLRNLGWQNEIVMIPSVALWLSSGIVLTEIFVSSPTRPKRNLQVAIIPIAVAIVLSLTFGLVSSGIYTFLDDPNLGRKLFKLNPADIRRYNWILLGLTVAISESLAWWWRSLEAKDSARFWKRLLISIIASIIAGWLASNAFEYLRSLNIMDSYKKLEDPIGLMLLGIFLGLAFGLSTSPSYMAALRAGAGFEFECIPDPASSSEGRNTQKPMKILDPKGYIQGLRFIGNFPPDEGITEGMSIQLPNTNILQKILKILSGNAKGVVIGSDENPDGNIRLANVPFKLAEVRIGQRETWLHPEKGVNNQILVDGTGLSRSTPVRLKHNTILTFYCNDEINFYRFVYYNRFLDPLS